MRRISKHRRLTLEQGVEMIDVCGRVYLSDLVFARAATISFATIVNRFGENEIMQEYLGKFVKVMIGMVLGYAIQGDAGLSPFESLSRLSQSSMHFSLLKWLLNLSLPDLNLKLAHILSALHQQYKTATGKDCNRLKDLLAEIGYFPDEIQGGWGEGGGREDAEEEEVIDTILPLGTAELIESPVARPKEIASFPYSRIHHDLARISQTRHEREAQNKLYQEQLSKEAALRYRSIKQQLEIRKIEQKVMRGVADDDSLAIYPYNSTTKAPLHLDESHIYEFSPEEDLDLYHLRTVQKRYKRALKAIFTKYSGTGFLARRDVGSSFDNVTERKERMTEAELGKALTMGKVVPMLIGKEEVRSVMKGYCARIAHQHDLSSIDFPNFCDLLPQLSFSIYHHYSWPPAIQFKELMIYLQKQCDGLGVSWEVFEDGGVGCGDRDVARRLNEMLREDGDTPLPTNYELHYLSDISYSHSVPPCLPLPHSFTISLEIIDSLLHSAFDVHILEPQITITSLPYAKGKPISPSKHTTVLKIPRPPINEIYTTHTLSPVLKLELAKMEAIMQPFALECAQTLENMLISVDLGLNRVINRGNGVKIQRKSDIYKEKIEFRLNKPEKSDFSHKKPTEPPLRIRISIEKHAEKLKKAKEAEENRKFLEAEAAKRNSVKLLREKDARHRALKLYLEQKESERVRKSAEMEEIVRELEEKRKKAQETSYKQLQSRLDAVIKSKQDQWRLIREKSSLSPSKIRENKSLHHQFAAKMMEKDKERAVLKLEKAREMKEFEGKEEVKGMMEKAGRQIEGFFRFFCRRGEFRMEMEGERELELQDFAKMAADVSLVPTLLSPELLSFLFKSLTKHKPPNNGRPLTLNLSDFTQSLFVIADLCKEQLNDMRGEPGETLNPGTLAALLGFLRMDRTAGEMNEFLRGLLEGRKREGSRARRVSRSKRSPSSLLSIPPLPLTTSHDSDYSDVRISRDPTPFRGVVSSRRGTSQLTKSFELSKSSQRVRDSGYD